MTALLIPVHGKPYTVESKGPKFTLAELQELVGGYIERVPNTGKSIWYCDEDGLRKKLPLNIEATKRWRWVLEKSGQPYHQSLAQLHGPVLNVGEEQ